MKCVVALLLCIGSGIKSALLNKDEGETCKVEGVEEWVCKTLVHCPQIGDFRSSRPDLCGFKGKDPVICCPPNKNGNSNPSNDPTTTTGFTQSTSTDESYVDVILLPGEATDEMIPNVTSTESPKTTEPPSGPPPGTPPTSIMKCIEYEVTICKLVNLKDDPPIMVRRDVSRSPVKIDFKKFLIESRNVDYDQFPFHVLIGFGNETNISWECSGSIISQFWVLSAAHCAQSGGKGATMIGIGSTKIEIEFSGFTIPISDIIVHPLYEPPAMYHDIALFKHNLNIGFGAFVHPVCVYPLKVLPHKSNTTIWGRTPQDKNVSRLKYIELKTADPKKCEQVYNNSVLLPRGFDDKIMFCAGDTYLDSCTGDSGAPLFYKSSVCLNVQVGIASYALPCGNYPGIFTKVSYYEPWIVKNVWPDYKFKAS